MSSPNEILIKGADGAWYVLKGDEMVPYEPAQISAMQKFQTGKETPKGVSAQEHTRLEKSEIRSTKSETISNIPAQDGSALGGQYPISKQPPSLSGAPAGVSHEGHPLQKELEEIGERVISESQLLLSDPVLQKRFRTIISARLRDVRDTMETREVLTRTQKVGGMGLKDEEVKRVLDVLERAFGEFQKKWKEVEAKRAEVWKKKQAEAVQKDEERKKKEDEELEERYRKLVGKEKGTVRQGAAQPVAPLPQSAQKPLSDAPARQPQLSAHPRSPSAPARSASATLLPPAAAGDVMREEKKVISPPQPRAPKPYIPTPKPPQKITDIRPAPKQLGPVEEIGSLTLEDFRRIPGNTSHERVANIISKIDFLGKESLARKMKGIEAWRISPLNQLYFQVVQASLGERISPEAVLKKWGEAGKQTLTEDEFHAIMELNQKLRF